MAQLVIPTQAEGQAPLPPFSPEELAPHFPQLEILSCLGRGGMGVVYKARQKSLNRLVALKLLAPERADDAAFAARFAREAQALAALSHPNIVAVHDFGEAGGFYFLLMEYVDGVNLRQLLQSKRLSPEEALSIVPPICEALQCAHDRGIVHRDIKPENLLLDRQGVVKIADFGIAKMVGLDAEDSTDSIFGPTDTLGRGTPRYAAPEQADRALADPRSDIFSLGVVLYVPSAPPEEAAVPGSGVAFKLNNIILPNLAFDKAPLRDVMAWFRQKCAELDTFDPAKSGLNFVVKHSQRPLPVITLEMSNVSAHVALDQVCAQAGMELLVEPYAVVLRFPTGANELETRTFSIPPNFLELIGARDPGLSLREALSVVADLSAPGSNVSHLGGMNRLVVRTTREQLEAVEELVDFCRRKPEPGKPQEIASEGSALLFKLNNIVLESVALEGATVEEAFGVLRKKSRELDMDPAHTGINFVIRPSPVPRETVTLSLKNVPMLEAVNKICGQAGLTSRVEPYQVTIHSLNDPQPLSVRYFRVPENGPKDLNAKAQLTAMGVDFSAAGSGTLYLPGLNAIVLKNTHTQTDLAAELIGEINKNPKMLENLPTEVAAEVVSDPFAGSGSGSSSFGGSEALPATPVPVVPVPKDVTIGSVFKPAQKVKVDVLSERPHAQTAAEIIRASKVKVLTRHYEETLADTLKAEKDASLSKGDPKAALEQEAKLRREYLAKLEAEMATLTEVVMD